MRRTAFALGPAEHQYAQVEAQDAWRRTRAFCSRICMHDQR
jgi:hypothetical protein